MALPSLDTEQQIKIQALIKGWQGKLTWHLLVTSVENNLGITTTRQTLTTYNSIKNTYKVKKQDLKGNPVQVPELLKHLQSDIALAETIVQLKNEIEGYKENVDHLQNFIKEISLIAQSNPAVMDVFQETMRKIKG